MDTRRAFLTDRVALVTGAGAGIGRGIALAYASFGARVVILELDPESGRATAAAITGAGGQAEAFPTDVRERDAVDRTVAAAVARFGRIDVLVNNVGGVFQQAFLDSREKGWDALLRANLKSVMYCTHAVAPRMIEQGDGGSIINIVSIEAVRAAPLYAVYAAAKAAVVSFTQSMAVELGPHRVRVNALAPDICLTEGLEKMLGDTEKARHPHLVPLGRAGVPDDVAGAAVFLASDLAAYVTGVTLHVDGGTHAAGGWYRDPSGAGWLLGPTPKRS